MRFLKDATQRAYSDMMRGLCYEVDLCVDYSSRYILPVIVETHMKTLTPKSAPHCGDRPATIPYKLKRTFINRYLAV